MLVKLKKLIKELGYLNVANDLGYHSINTIKNWVNKNEIPGIAKAKVKRYLEQKGIKCRY